MKLIAAANAVSHTPFASALGDEKPSYTRITNVTILGGLNAKPTKGLDLIRGQPHS